MRSLSLLPVLTILLLCGCSTDQRVLEDLGIINTTSYDIAPNTEEEGKQQDRLLITVSIPKSTPEGKFQKETLSTIARSSREARIKLSKQTELNLVNGQLRDTLFGSDLARKGIKGFLDPLERDALISKRLKVTVVDGSAHDLLMRSYPHHPRTGQYINRLLEKEAKHQTIPKVMLYQFMRDLLDDGIDPVAPIIKEGQKNVVLDGIALFHGDRYTAKIEPEKTIIFSLLRGTFKQGDMVVHLQENEQSTQTHATISSLVSKRKIQISHQEGKPFKALFNIRLKGSILEYDGDLDMTKKTDRRKMETLIANYIKNEAGQMFLHLLKNNVDSTGIGTAVRNTLPYREWKQLDWDKVYPQTEVSFNIKVKINSYGLFK